LVSYCCIADWFWDVLIDSILQSQGRSAYTYRQSQGHNGTRIDIRPYFVVEVAR